MFITVLREKEREARKPWNEKKKKAGKKKKLGEEQGLGREKEGVRKTGGEKGQGRGERRRGKARQKSTLFGLDFVLIATSYITALKEALNARRGLLIAQR